MYYSILEYWFDLMKIASKLVKKKQLELAVFDSFNDFSFNKVIRILIKPYFMDIIWLTIENPFPCLLFLLLKKSKKIQKNLRIALSTMFLKTVTKLNFSKNNLPLSINQYYINNALLLEFEQFIWPNLENNQNLII